MDREQISIRLPFDLKQNLETVAVKKGLSFNSFILSLLNDFIQKAK